MSISVQSFRRDAEVSRTKLNLTRLNTVADKSMSVSKLLKFDDIRMNEALESATSPIGAKKLSATHKT